MLNVILVKLHFFFHSAPSFFRGSDPKLKDVRQPMNAASSWLTLCWRVAPPAPEGFISTCLRGREAAPFAPIHSAPPDPERFWRVCMHGTVCFRYNVCVDRSSAFFSWLSVEQAHTSESQLPYLVTPQRRCISNRWTWHLFRHHLRRPLLRLLLCKEGL